MVASVSMAVTILVAMAFTTLAVTRDPMFALPSRSSPDAQARADAITDKRRDFIYGPDIVTGGGAFFPSGPLGEEYVKKMSKSFFPEQEAYEKKVRAEAEMAIKAVMAEGGLRSFDDYKKLYHNHWKTAIPNGLFPGILSNGTSDLLFAMLRLSANPYSLRRVQATERLAFAVEDSIATSLTSLTQSALQAAGRLFYIDYRDMASLLLTEGRYAGACDAYFFIHPESEDFLPLAIRPNNGCPLIYTPKDSAQDWQLAKIIFAQNDYWWAGWSHLASVHELAELVFQAAIRTLSDAHPVFAILTRLAYQIFVIRVKGVQGLINVGGPIDQLASWNGKQAGIYTTKLYHQGLGSWRDSYFETDLVKRGLIKSTFGPDLKHFPYYSDASILHASISKFLSTFVMSYYPTDNAVAADYELQAFVAEAKPAKIIDFERDLTSRAALSAFLTQFAFLVSIKHGVINAGDPVHTTTVLPYNPTALYSPLPESKGVSDLLPFMPNVTQAAGQITFFGLFNRPFIAETNRTLASMFDDPQMLAQMNEETRRARNVFQFEMDNFSKVVRARRFDGNGLCQGMPFVWPIMDPKVMPFFVAI